MSLVAEMKTLLHLTLAPVRGQSHADRLEGFYRHQAEDYDRFRRRLLHGREELYRSLPVAAGTRWVDLGGGTGANLELLADRLADMAQVFLVDLSPSLLAVAARRAQARGWRNVVVAEADATSFVPPGGPVDVVTCSYALTMIPDWFQAIDQAVRLLRPGGWFAAVDFYVGRKYPAAGRDRQGWFTRHFWPTWFALDNVHLSADHLPYLQSRFNTVELVETRAQVPYLPGLRVPVYRFLGRKPAA